MDKYIGFDIDSKKKVACVVQKCKPITNRQRPLNPFAQNLRLLIKFKASYTYPINRRSVIKLNLAQMIYHSISNNKPNTRMIPKSESQDEEDLSRICQSLHKATDLVCTTLT